MVKFAMLYGPLGSCATILFLLLGEAK